MRSVLRSCRALIAACGAIAGLAIAADTQRITPFPVGSLPQDVAVAPNGEIWWTEWGTHNVCVMQTDGTMHVFQRATAPSGITAGTYSMYVALPATGCVYRISWYNHAIAAEDCSVPAPALRAIVFDDENNLYRSTPSGVVATPVSGGAPVTLGNGDVVGMVKDPVSPASIVYASATGKIGFAGIRAGVAYECPVGPGRSPSGIAVGADGLFYFTERDGDRIGRVDSQCHLTEWAVGAGSHPLGIVRGPDGNIWFAESDTNRIGRLVPSTGVITEFEVWPGASGIAADGRGNLWITATASDTLVRFRVFDQGDVNGDAKVDVMDVFYLINFLFAGGGPPVN